MRTIPETCKPHANILSGTINHGTFAASLANQQSVVAHNATPVMSVESKRLAYSDQITLRRDLDRVPRGGGRTCRDLR